MGKAPFTWSANNNSTRMCGEREARSLRAAVIAARSFLWSELCGEGVMHFYCYGKLIRTDERSMFTGYKMKTTFKNY